MSNFIAVAIAHDYTCPKGDEWLFHNIPKPDIGDMDKKDVENDTFWTWVIATIISLLIGAGVVAFIIMHGR